MTVAKPVAANLALPRRRKPASPVARLAATPLVAPLVPLLRAVVPPLLGLLAFLLLWTLVSQLSKGSLPGPVSTWPRRASCLPTRSTRTAPTTRA